MTRNTFKNILGAGVIGFFFGIAIFATAQYRHHQIAHLVLQNHSKEPVEFSILLPDPELVAWSIRIPANGMVSTPDYPKSRSFPWDRDFLVKGEDSGRTWRTSGETFERTRHIRPNDYTFLITEDSIIMVWESGRMRP